MNLRFSSVLAGAKTLSIPEGALSSNMFERTLTLSAFALLAMTVVPAFGQSVAAPQGVPHDWSHRHLIYSAPVTLNDTVSAATDHRYSMQWIHTEMCGARRPFSSGSGPALSMTMTTTAVR